MYDSGIVQVIFPVTKYDQALHLKAIKVTQLFNTHVDLTVIYALLFDISLKELLKLKFSRASAIRVIKILQLKESLGEKSLPLLLKTIWLEDKSFVSYFVFASTLLEDNKIVYDLFVSLKNNSIPNFPLDGNDLIKLGYVGENLGKLIKNLKHKWIESDFTLNKEQMINMVKNNEI